jgi:transcriptional regulator with XRE-family HTH domain
MQTFTLGMKIKARRKELNLTTEELAEKAKCSASVLRKYEANMQPNPDEKTVRGIAEALQLDPEYLMHDSTAYKADDPEIFNHLPDDLKEWISKAESKPLLMFAKRISEGMDPADFDIMVEMLRQKMIEKKKLEK